MAKQLSSDTLNALTSILKQNKPLYKLTPSLAVNLALQGMLTIRDDGKLIITDKALRAYKRSESAVRQQSANMAVAYVIRQLLPTPQSAFQTREVWTAVGREMASYVEIGNGLKTLRDAGVLRSFKKNGNNFHQYWTMNEEVPQVEFSTNGDPA
jgi:hypothetical protein